jgi:hypothetical protein
MREEVSDVARSCQEIARRTLALFGVIGIALRAPRTDIIDWLKEENLWDELSPCELAYATAEKPGEKETINATWWSERLIVLLWALRMIENLPAPNEQCDTAIFQELLPPFVDVAAAEFVRSAECRSENALRQMANELMHLHWQVRDARLHSKPAPSHIDIEIIQERHHAINWVIGWDGSPWDDVTTDT